MKTRVATSVIALFMAFTGTFCTAEEESPEKVLSAWGEDFMGSWVMTPSKLEVDLPGLGKKGDSISSHVTIKLEDGLYYAKSKMLINDTPVSNGIAVFGWDGAKKGIKGFLVTKDFASISLIYRMDGDQWLCEVVTIDPDGTESSNTATMIVSEDGNKHTYHNKNRMRDGQSLPDDETVWTRN